MELVKKTYNYLEQNKILTSVSIGIIATIVFSLFYDTYLYQYFETEYRRLIFSRVVICLMSFLLVLIGVRQREKVFVSLKDYFTATAAPINLSVFRIILFGYLLMFPELNQLIWFSQFPKELIFEPTGFKWALSFLPTHTDFIVNAYYLYRIFCFLAMIGFLTRFSIISATILGIYVIGFPQFFGKISHYHHLLWFSMILATCPCSDVFSIDSIVKAFRRADSGDTNLPKESISYALPIRIIWILFGVIYFFPGVWKVWGAGFDWALGENLKFQLYNKWTEIENWAPLFRIDQYPILYHMVGIGTIIFEIGFIFCLFSKLFRTLAVLSGIIFHNMTKLFMNIYFFHLLVIYVVFFNWNKIFTWIGQCVFKQEANLLFDGNCKLCRRTICVLQAFDIFHRINYINILDKKAIDDHNLKNLNMNELLVDMHLIIGQKKWKGYYAYRALALRLPLLWPLLPFLYLWPVTWLGGKIYRMVADSRLCQIAYTSVSRREFKEPEVNNRLRFTIIIGAFLILGNFGYGFLKLYNGWPLTCYPTFAYIARDFSKTLEISGVDHNGIEKPLNVDDFSRKFGASRFHGLIRNILRKKSKHLRKQRIKALGELWKSNDPNLKNFKIIKFYHKVYLVAPEFRNTKPLSQELIYEMKV